jgi:hypothetical protein
MLCSQLSTFGFNSRAKTSSAFATWASPRMTVTQDQPGARSLRSQTGQDGMPRLNLEFSCSGRWQIRRHVDQINTRSVRRRVYRLRYIKLARKSKTPCRLDDNYPFNLPFEPSLRRFTIALGLARLVHSCARNDSCPSKRGFLWGYDADRAI